MSNSDHPLSIEHIFSQSFGIALKTIRTLLPLYAALICASAAYSYQYDQGNLFLTLLLGLILTIVSCYISSAAVLVSHRLWRGEEPEDRQSALKKIDLLLVFEIGWLTIRVALTSVPLLLCLIVPGLIYMINRSLASYPLIISRVTVSEALRESRQLMTSQPWYSIHGPQLRISGLLFVTSLLAIGIAIALLIISAIVALASHLIFGDTTGAWMPWAFGLLGAFIQQYMTIFGLVMMTGFYLDLKNRTAQSMQAKLRTTEATVI